MKKALFGTSAISLISMVVGPVSAAEWDVDVGGVAQSYVLYAATDFDNSTVTTDFDGVDVYWDGEIHFQPSITLDNGIKIGADIQLEARASASAGVGTPDIIDEAYTYIKGSFGEVLIGDENSAGYKLHFSAPNRSGLGVNSPGTLVIPISGNVGGVGRGGDIFRGTLGATFLENERNNDAGRITYFTPRFAGFQLGASYARDATQNTAGFQNTSATAASDIFDVGANYTGSFSGVEVGASARWGIATDNRTAVAGTDIGSDPTILGFGGNIGFAGFTIGGSWAEQNNAGDEDGTAYEVGIAYDTGPWGFSFNYFHGENVDEEATVAGDSSLALNTIAGLNDEEQDQFQLGVNYKLAKGTNLNLVASYVEFDEEISDGGAATGGDDISGFYLGTGVRISF